MNNTINNNNITNYTHNTYNVKYAITEKEYKYEGEVRISYGINAYCVSDGIVNDIPCLSVNDISSDKNSIAALVDKFNESNVSLEHVYELIDDSFDVIAD